MRKLLAGFLLAAATTGALLACGGDDDQGINPLTGMKTDGSAGNGDGSPGNKDGGPNGGNDGSPNGGEGGPGTDSGCAFTNFVIDQITNHTSEDGGPVSQANIPDPTCSIDQAGVFSSLTTGKP